MQVWAHWNHCIHMHLSFLGPVYCAFSPWVSYQGWQQKLTARWGTSCLHPKFFQGHCQGGCKVVASWLQHPLFAGMVGSIFHSQKGGLKACPSQALLLQQVCPALAVSLWPLDMPGLAYRKQLLFSEHLFWRWRDSQRLAFFKQHLEEMTNSSENLSIQRHKFFFKAVLCIKVKNGNNHRALWSSRFSGLPHRVLFCPTSRLEPWDFSFQMGTVFLLFDFPWLGQSRALM